MRSLLPCNNSSQPPALALNSYGNLDFPGPTQEETCIPRRNSRILPQLEKKQQYIKKCKQINKKDLDVNLSSVSYYFVLYYFISQTGCGSQWWYWELSCIGFETGWGTRLEEPPFSQGCSRSCVLTRTVSSELFFLRQCFSLTCLWTYPL